MTGITLAEAETHLTTWLDADKAVAKGQSFSISGKTYTRADAQVIRESIEFWDRQGDPRHGRGGGRTNEGRDGHLNACRRDGIAYRRWSAPIPGPAKQRPAVK